jgi:hypothetical protein
MGKKKVAFISGPYRSNTVWGIKNNIFNAQQVALKYWKLGYVVICPHGNSSFFDGECDDSVWLEGDLELLSRSDVCVMMDSWKKSSGSIIERDYALKNNIPIIYD